MSPLSRKVVDLKAEFIRGTKKYYGVIFSLSHDDVCLSLPSSLMDHCHPGTSFQLRLHPDSGDTLDFTCKVKWTYPDPPHGVTNSLGAEVLDPVYLYRSFYSKLQQ